MAHDPLDAVEQVHDELEQLEQTGFSVRDLTNRFAETSHDRGFPAEDFWRSLESLQRDPGWPYDEPDDLPSILAALPVSEPEVVEVDDLEDRLLGAWQGRIAGCNVGKPVEDGFRWSRASLREYLELAGAYPLRDYVPALDPMPPGFALRPDNWRSTTRGNVDGSARDDDIDYAILALHMLETHTAAFTRADVAAAWLELLPYGQVYTAERVTYRNLLQGHSPDLAGEYRNPYREWIGALIRGDVFGYVNPGRPRSAAVLAYQDASLSHRANGIYGEMWSAALVAAAFSARTLGAVVATSLRQIPPRSRLHRAVSQVVSDHERGLSWEETLAAADRLWDGYSWVHTINNAAAITAGLLYSEEDPATAIGLTVMAGLDTDSNAATVGSVLGAFVGASGLPSHLVDPLKDRVRSALFGFDHLRISELSTRTAAIVRSNQGLPISAGSSTRSEV